MPNLDNSEIKFEPAGTESNTIIGGFSIEYIPGRETEKGNMTYTNGQTIKCPVSTSLEQGASIKVYSNESRENSNKAKEDKEK